MFKKVFMIVLYVFLSVTLISILWTLICTVIAKIAGRRS